MTTSHIKAVITKAGYIPKDKKVLYESHMSSCNQFFDIVKLREQFYCEAIVRKKIRKGEIKSYQEAAVSVN